MNNLQQLYVTIGQLQSLLDKEFVILSEIDFLEVTILENLYFSKHQSESTECYKRIASKKFKEQNYEDAISFYKIALFGQLSYRYLSVYDALNNKYSTEIIDKYVLAIARKEGLNISRKNEYCLKYKDEITKFIEELPNGKNEFKYLYADFRNIVNDLNLVKILANEPEKIIELILNDSYFIVDNIFLLCSEIKDHESFYKILEKNLLKKLIFDNMENAKASYYRDEEERAEYNDYISELESGATMEGVSFHDAYEINDNSDIYAPHEDDRFDEGIDIRVHDNYLYEYNSDYLKKLPYNKFGLQIKTFFSLLDSQNLITKIQVEFIFNLFFELLVHIKTCPKGEKIVYEKHICRIINKVNKKSLIELYFVLGKLSLLKEIKEINFSQIQFIKDIWDINPYFYEANGRQQPDNVKIPYRVDYKTNPRLNIISQDIIDSLGENAPTMEGTFGKDYMDNVRVIMNENNNYLYLLNGMIEMNNDKLAPGIYVLVKDTPSGKPMYVPIRHLLLTPVKKESIELTDAYMDKLVSDIVENDDISNTMNVYNTEIYSDEDVLIHIGYDEEMYPTFDNNGFDTTTNIAHKLTIYRRSKDRTLYMTKDDGTKGDIDSETAIEEIYNALHRMSTNVKSITMVNATSLTTNIKRVSMASSIDNFSTIFNISDDLDYKVKIGIVPNVEVPLVNIDTVLDISEHVTKLNSTSLLNHLYFKSENVKLGLYPLGGNNTIESIFNSIFADNTELLKNDFIRLLILRLGNLKISKSNVKSNSVACVTRSADGNTIHNITINPESAIDTDGNITELGYMSIMHEAIHLLFTISGNKVEYDTLLRGIMDKYGSALMKVAQGHSNSKMIDVVNAMIEQPEELITYAMTHPEVLEMLNNVTLDNKDAKNVKSTLLNMIYRKLLNLLRSIYKDVTLGDSALVIFDDLISRVSQSTVNAEFGINYKDISKQGNTGAVEPQVRTIKPRRKSDMINTNDSYTFPTYNSTNTHIYKC